MNYHSVAQRVVCMKFGISKLPVCVRNLMGEMWEEILLVCVYVAIGLVFCKLKENKLRNNMRNSLSGCRPTYISQVKDAVD